MAVAPTLTRHFTPTRSRLAAVVSALALVALSAGWVGGGSAGAASPAPGAFGGFFIDGSVPDAGASAYTDPDGNVSELGPKNAATTKVGVIDSASPAMLDFTNPNAQTDLKTVWMNTGKDLLGATWLYFGWERDANSGSGQIMFEFDRNARPVACDYTGVSQTTLTAATQTLIDACNPWANRAAGDFVIVWDWSGGATTIVKRTFVASGGGLALDAGTTLSAADAKAAYSADLFRGEAAVNLSATVFPAVPTSCFTVANVIPGTVTGNSDTADYKDVVLNAFADQYISNCGSVRVTKVTNPTGQSGSFPVTLDRSGGGDINYAHSKTTSQTLTGDQDVKTFTDLLPGSDYRLAEATVPGWDLVSIVCGANAAGAPITVVAGVQTSCTVTNLKRAPALQLTKTATPPTYDAVGDTISYSYAVKNTGNVVFAGPVTVADDKATVTCPALPAGGLAVGATTTCTATYTITQAALNAGSVTNIAKASANGTDSNQDTATVTAVQTKTLLLVKTASPTTYSKVGDVISYSYAVTNTGNVTFAGPVTVSDDKVTVTCPALPAGGLVPGATTTCTASHVITQTDLDVGAITNLARASANGINSNQDTATVTAAQTRALTLDKTASPATYSKVGDVISYSYAVKNTGNVTLAGPVTVADDKATVTCPALPAGGLLPGATTTCTASYTITQHDLDVGAVTNVATASSNGINSLPDNATVTAVQTKSLLLAKSASPATYDAVGQTISYSYKVTNTGNVTLAGPLTVTDDKATVTCPAGSLAPGAFLTCTATYTITQHDLDFGPVTNVATASAGGVTSNQDTATVRAVQKPALSIDKTATPATYSKVGDVVTYQYVVTNSGNVTLAGPITVVDDKVTTSCPGAGSLAPGATLTCTASYTIKLADLDAGSVTNVAYATNGPTKSATDTVTVTAVQSRSLTIDKTATEKSYSSVGTVLHYSYLVTNTGNVTLSSISVVDDRTPVTCPQTPLAPGASFTCTATYTVTQADMNSGSVKNTAYAKSGATQSPPDSVTIPLFVPPIPTSPDLSIVKAGPAAAVRPGDDVPYTLTVKNIGTGAATGVQVNDALPAAMTFVSASGVGWTCTGTSSIGCSLAGSLAAGATAPVINVVAKLASDYPSTAIANTAVVLPTDENPSNNSSTATTPVTLPTPPVDQDLGISKTALEGSVGPGDVLSWTIAVTNVKGTPAAAFTVTDVVPDGLSLLTVGGADWACSSSGQTVSCTYTGVPLAVGSSSSFQLDSLVGADYTGSTVTNTAIVDPGGVDTTNDSATAVTPVVFTGGGGGPVFEPSPSPSPSPAPSGGEALPFTGSYAQQALSVGVAVLLFGLMLALIGRRRRAS